MATILFDKIVYGPVHSRRLGVSLGINLFPKDGKLCTFNCIYCEKWSFGGHGELVYYDSRNVATDDGW